MRNKGAGVPDDGEQQQQPPQRQPGTSAGPFRFVHQQPASQQQQPWQSRQRQSLSPGPLHAITVPIAQRASCHFAANFILVPLHLGASPHGFMEYLVPLIESEPSDSALQHAFNACAFALLGNRAKADSFDLAQLSLKEHTLALAQTHKALGHPALANSDATLAAVLMLCLYEVRPKPRAARHRPV